MRLNNQNGKRSRGRARRPNGFNQPNVNRNTTFESNGPEGKLRGNAQQLYEKYTALAHDANSSSERISAEAFSQFADHYYRVHQTILAAMEQKRNLQENKSDTKQKPLDENTTGLDNSLETNKNLGDKNKESQNSKELKTTNTQKNIVQDSGEITTIVIDKESKSDENEDVRQNAGDAVA